MSTDKFNPATWIIGALFALTVMFGGAAFAFQSSAISATQAEVAEQRKEHSEHAERLKRLETLMETQVEINRELKELHKLRDGRGAQ